jgi:hypothetical protein
MVGVRDCHTYATKVSVRREMNASPSSFVFQLEEISEGEMHRCRELVWKRMEWM